MDPSNNFQIFRTDRPGTKRGGGVLIALQMSYLAYPVLSMALENFELICIDITDFCAKTKIRVIAVYRPPKLSDNSTEILLNTISDLCAIDLPIILLGDFNLHNDPVSENFSLSTLSLGLTQHVTMPTRGNTILDLIFSNVFGLVSDISSLPPFASSDHNILNFSAILPKAKYLVKPYRDFKRADFILINNFFSTINWQLEFSGCGDMDSIYDRFLCVVNHAIETFIPFVHPKKPIQKLPVHIQNLINFREKIWPKISDPQTKIKAIAATKRLSKELLKFQRYKERKVLNQGPHKIYGYVSKFLKPKSSRIPVLMSEGKPIYAQDDKAELFVNYFHSVFTTHHLELPDFDSVNGRLEYVHIFEDLLIGSFKKLQPKINLSPDGLNGYFLKNCFHSVLPAILHIFQYSCYSGALPSLWKKAFVVPLLKSNPPNLVSNYRPISLTSPLCKVLERIIYDKLLFHLSTHKILPECQHGFRSGKSVTTQLVETLDDFTLAIENKKLVDVIYFDFAKAFDSIPHEALLHKLEKAGVGGSLLLWIRNFLIGRTFSVIVGDSFSSNCPVPSGTPQGSVLGPLLFIFYISDLPLYCEVNGVKVKLFADDLKAYCIHNNELEKLHALQFFVDRLETWVAKNGLRLQSSKCKVLYLGTDNKKHPYRLGGQTLESVQVIRDLGLYISEDLKWKNHVHHISKLALNRLYLLFKSIRSCDIALLLKLYKTYILSLLDFGSPIYNPYLKQDVAVVEKVQKRFVFLLFSRCLRHAFASMPAYSECLEYLGLEPLSDRRLRQDLNFIHQIVRGEIKISTQTPLVSGRKTNKNIHGIMVDFARSNVRHNLLLCRAASKYIKLPPHIQALPSKNFKEKLRALDIASL